MYYYKPPPKKKYSRYLLFALPSLIILIIISHLFFGSSNVSVELTPTTPIIQNRNSVSQERTVIPLPEASEKTTTSTIVNKQIQVPNSVNKPTKIHTAPPPRFINKTFTVKSGDTLSKIASQANISNQTLYSLLDDIKHTALIKNLKLGSKFKFEYENNKDTTLNSIQLELSPYKTLYISKQDNHKWHSEIREIEPKLKVHHLSAQISDSLYKTGIENHIPQKLLYQLTKIFARQIDFSKDLRDSDHFTLIYETRELENHPTEISKILAASFTNRTKTHIAIRYQKFDESIDYFTPTGHSLRLSFDRYPIKFTHISSQYNPQRMHPILHTFRPHKGVDLAARLGTPIHAVADGTVAQIGQNRGYGNMIKLKHSSKYETVYAHMNKFKSGLSQGSHVKRGQVIGYVGQTGLATAPHCHFEFRVYGQTKDPLTVSLPAAKGITNKNLDNFKQKTETLLSKLKKYEEKYNKVALK